MFIFILFLLYILLKYRKSVLPYVFSSVRQNVLSVKRHKQGEEMMQSLELNLNFWSLLLVSMVHVLLLLLLLHHISKRYLFTSQKVPYLSANNTSLDMQPLVIQSLTLRPSSLEHPMEKELIAGPKKFHVFLLWELLLVLPLLRLKIVLKQTYVFLLLKEYFI